MDKIFIFNEYGVCTNPNIPVSWVGDNTSMGWSFRIYTAQSTKGWLAGCDYYMGDSCGSHGCNQNGSVTYQTQKEAIYNTLKHIEEVVPGKTKCKSRKEILSELRKYINQYDIRQLELFN